MSKVITARLDDELLALVDRVAGAQGRSRARFVADAVQRVAEHESELHDFIQIGVDAADRGELISQQEIERWLEDRIANRRASPIADK